jgi:hypothetical protein
MARIWMSNTGGHRRRSSRSSKHSVQEINAMSGLLFLAVFFGILVVASAFGWTADTREGGDWSPSDDGRRSAPC